MNSPVETIEATHGEFPFASPRSTAAARTNRFERRQAALAALGTRGGTPCDPQLLLENGAALIAETLGTDQYGVAEPNADGGARLRLWDCAISADGTPARPRETRYGSGQTNALAAVAVASQQSFCIENLSDHERVEDPALQVAGLRSALVLPVSSHDPRTPALVAFSRTPRRFTADELMFAETIGHLVSTTISRDRALQVLAEERQFTRKMLETVDALVLVLSVSGRIVRVNRAFEVITGFSMQEVQDRPIWNFLLAPDEVHTVQEVLARLAGGAGSQVHESFVLTKRGERRRIRWSHTVLTRSEKGVDTLIGTGLDITAQREAEARTRRSEAARRQAHVQLQGVLSIVDGNPSELSPPAYDSDLVGHSSAAAAEMRAIAKPAGVETFAAEAPISRDPSSDQASEPSPFDPLPVPEQAERRNRPRRSFTYCQRIAPMEGDKPPPQSLYRVVQCHDISAGGFAFVSATQPAHENYVVVLGSAPVLIYVKVRVAHITPKKIEGREVFLVGCKYTGRVDY